MDKIGFIQYVAEQARPHLERIVTHFLPGGKREGREYQPLNPKRADATPGSFSINLDTGQWADFATGDKGGDAISLVAYLDGGNQRKAAETVAALLGINSKAAPASPRAANAGRKEEWTPITPLPDNAPTPPSHHFKHGEPVGRWTYHDANGRTVCYVCRFETAEGKSFTPLTYCQSADGQRTWRWQGLPAPRPLYNSHRLQDYPKAIIIVCEGEKAADAAAVLFPLPDYVITTPMNGAQSPSKTDWTPLAHRTAWLWPDNDAAGRGFADAVCKLIRAAQQNEAPEDRGAIHEIRLDFFKRMPDGTERELPAKWDAADAVADGFTAEHINSVFLSDPANLTPPRLEAEAAADAFKEQEAAAEHERQSRQEANGFTVVEWQKGRRNGVYYQAEGDDSPKWICDPIRVVAQSRDTSNSDWGYLLEWQDNDGVAHSWLMPAELLESPDEYRKALRRGGLGLASSSAARNLLTAYIQTAPAINRVRCVDKTGWYGKTFVFPHRTIGEQSKERVLYQATASRTENRFGCSGDLADWQTHIGRLCAGNTRLVFACCAGFAAPMLHPVHQESGGFHFDSVSSIGKSTVLRVAASLYGPPKYRREWRQTANGIEGSATSVSDCLFLLDEIGQADAKQAGEALYMVANGQGKQRANKDGSPRPVATWRVLMLSSGELSLADLLREAGKTVRAGQEVRLLHIPADPGKGLGVYDTLPEGFRDGAALSNHLALMTETYYGTPIVAFIESLQREDWATFATEIREVRDHFVDKYVPSGASGQVTRAAQHFGLCAAAGEVATRYGITGWPMGESFTAAAACFAAWLDQRGGAGNQETRAILAQVLKFFEQHGDSRFTRKGTEGQQDYDVRTIINRAGAVEYDGDGQPTFYVLTETFEQELCRGFKPATVKKVLLAAGLLQRGEKNRFAQPHRLPGIGNAVRCYVITPFHEQD